MSEYVNKFISQHSEYFQRNKKQIESNRWNDLKNYEDTLDKFTNQILDLKETENSAQKIKKQKELEKEVRAFVESSKRAKDSLFKSENKLTNSVLGRLASFIKDAESDRHLPKTQKFIDETVEIIEIHLKKCKDYLNYTSENLGEIKTEDEIEVNQIEVDFQDTVFNERIKIENILSSLNINNSSDTLQISFFKNQKANLPMVAVFMDNQNYPDIARITKNLNLPTTTKDTSFFIHKKKEDIPIWNYRKNYWEQDKNVLDFWWTEWLKISNGIIIDNYKIHPWLYFHLNFFKTAIPSGGKILTINPPLRDNELYISELIKEAEAIKDIGILIYGSRRISKSTWVSSIAEWKVLTMKSASSNISSGSEADILDLGNKIKESMSNMVTAFGVPIQKQDWSAGIVEMGLKDGNTLIKQSNHKLTNLEKGVKSASQKLAGGNCDVFIIEEIGKTDWEKSYLAAQPAFETPEGYRTICILIGTSGEASLSKDSLKAVSDPSSLKLMEMNWDLLEKYIPSEAITWKKMKFASFVPAQMAYKTGLRKIEMGLGEYLGIDSKKLNEIKIQKTDWVHNKKVLEERRAKVKGDLLKLQQEIVQYPMCPSDCFLSSEKNIFNYEEATRRKEYLLQTGEWDRRFELYRDYDGKIKKKPSNKPLAEYPHKGNIDAPFLLFEDFPEEKQPLYTYIAGGDFFKQESSDTDSVGTIYIYKYDILGDKWAYRLVASYSSRPDTFNEFNKNCLMLLEAYNAVLFPENEDVAVFQSYLQKLHLEDYYLMPHIDFNSNLEFSVNGNRKIGWTPSQSKRKLMNMFANYTKENVKVINEIGEESIVERIHTINDIYLLTELINYNKDGNFDRITASLGAIGFLHYLEKNYIHPKRFISQKNIEKKVVERERNPYSLNGIRKKNPFSRRD
jgi:hypothetical protein